MEANFHYIKINLVHITRMKLSCSRHTLRGGTRTSKLEGRCWKWNTVWARFSFDNCWKCVGHRSILIWPCLLKKWGLPKSVLSCCLRSPLRGYSIMRERTVTLNFFTTITNPTLEKIIVGPLIDHPKSCGGYTSQLYGNRFTALLRGVENFINTSLFFYWDIRGQVFSFINSIHHCQCQNYLWYLLIFFVLIHHN